MGILSLLSQTAEASRWKSMKAIKSDRVFFSMFYLPIMMTLKMNGQVVSVQPEIEEGENKDGCVQKQTYWENL